jgi:hypothetical protein
MNLFLVQELICLLLLRPATNREKFSLNFRAQKVEKWQRTMPMTVEEQRIFSKETWMADLNQIYFAIFMYKFGRFLMASFYKDYRCKMYLVMLLHRESVLSWSPSHSYHGLSSAIKRPLHCINRYLYSQKIPWKSYKGLQVFEWCTFLQIQAQYCTLYVSSIATCNPSRLLEALSWHEESSPLISTHTILTEDSSIFICQL